MHTSTPAGTAAPSPSTQTAEPTAPPGVVGQSDGQHLHTSAGLLSVYPPGRDDRLYLAIAVHNGTASSSVAARLTREEAEQFATAICLALVS